MNKVTCLKASWHMLGKVKAAINKKNTDKAIKYRQ